MSGETVEDFEDYLLERSQKFLAALEEARWEYLKEGGISPEEYLKSRLDKKR
jgi:hypothetical protein